MVGLKIQLQLGWTERIMSRKLLASHKCREFLFPVLKI